ncbi:MAG: hypothetical protein QGI83_01710, partial [Candidatus Latescibacteria bacterium]|nr:hypothetical protein [Candidatus Latescibacterota bacterium]
LSLRLSRAFTGVLSADIGASRTRRGQATSMAEPPAGRVAFLAGPMLTGTRISAGVDYEPVRHLVFRIDYEAAYHRSTGTGEAGGVSENRSSWSIGAQYGFF